MRNSIRTRLTFAFIGLAIGPLLLVGVALIWQTWTVQQRQALNLQAEVAQRVSTQLAAFIQELQSELLVASQIRGLQGLTRDRQQEILAELGAYEKSFEELALLDSEGRELVRIAPFETVTEADLGERSGADEFTIPKTSKEIYFSPVRFDETINEPLMIVGIPLLNIRTQVVEGVLVANVRFKPIWDVIRAIPVGAGEIVYIIDAQNRVVAHPESSVVLRGTRFDPPQQGGIHMGLNEASVVLATNQVQFGEQRFTVVAEKNLFEALDLAINTVVVIAVLIIVALIIAVVLGFLVVRQIIRPVETLVATAQAISAGDLSQQAHVTSRDELGVLAETFNGMAAQLQEVIGSLEERVADRTQRLAQVATLTERLNAILDFNQLLEALVEQVKAYFGYGDVRVYVLDELDSAGGHSQHLILAAKSGGDEAVTDAPDQRLALNTSTSSVAQAARSREIIQVHQSEGPDVPHGLPSATSGLPVSEMAVPIILEEQVVGVLNVHEDKAAGLDEGDANLLRSLASQAAVAIRNARLFAEVGQALADAREAQERHIQQAWTTVKGIRHSGQHLSQRPGTPPLSEAVMARLEQTILRENQTTIVTADDAGASLDLEAETTNAVAVPIKLQSQMIGAIQVHEIMHPRRWTDEELSLIQAVADQVAQIAENLRLFDQTRERASREQAIREITDKLRSASNLETLVRIASQELGNRLAARYTKLELGFEKEQLAVKGDGQKS